MFENSVQCSPGGVRYAVLAKGGGVRILVRPTASQVWECGVQGWVLLDAIRHQPDAWEVLQETLRRAIPETDEAVDGTDRESGFAPIEPDDAWLYDSCTD
jgi:hypothetical protein